MTSTYTTYRDIGLRAEKKVAHHLLIENAYENNLITDIAEVDYTEGHLRRTDLWELDGIPMFIDDIYVYTYLIKDEVVYKGNKPNLTTGEEDQAKKVVVAIQMCIGATFGVNEKRVNVVILYTIKKQR